MKPLSIIVPILLPIAVTAQQDSLSVDTAKHGSTHSIVLMAGGQGVKLKVVPNDTLQAEQGDTLRILTKRSWC
ncbi:MAG TPA: hypothetical protein PLL18_07145, partial [Flavobacteriales bacterium]|nr:hypothetical protein [Flavobacteriales bacterium]